MAEKNLTKKTMIGGQAIIEGVMMIGPGKYAIVVRKQSGEHVVKEGELNSLAAKYKILGWPIIRGVVGFGRSMRRGLDAINWSSDAYIEDGGEDQAAESKLDKWLDEKMKSPKGKAAVMSVVTAIGLLIPIALFFVLPTFIGGLLDPYIGSGVLRNLAEGLIRLVIFFLFMLSVSQMNDMRRVFMYHGAEHKTIHCYEHGLPMTVENAQTFGTAHPRCGTSFLFVVMIVSIIVLSFFTFSNIWTRLAVRLGCLPLIVGLAYEFNRFVGRHDNWFTRILRAPGMWFQRFTTREPEDYMVEVAIDAFLRVAPDDDSDQW